MITETFFICLMFQMLVLLINVMAFTKIPILSIFSIGLELVIFVPTIKAFQEYEIFGMMFGLMNLTLPIIAIIKARHGD